MGPNFFGGPPTPGLLAAARFFSSFGMFLTTVSMKPEKNLKNSYEL
jgi:hypothetical protein